MISSIQVAVKRCYETIRRNFMEQKEVPSVDFAKNCSPCDLLPIMVDVDILTYILIAVNTGVATRWCK